MTPRTSQTFERCIAVGGVALFPADTVYGLATEPDSAEGVRRLYALKGRRADRPAAVMFFQLELALAALPELARADAWRARAAAARRRHAAAAEPGAALPARLRGHARDARRPGPSPGRSPGSAGRSQLAGAAVQRQQVRRAPRRNASRTSTRPCEPASTSSSTVASCPARPPRWSTSRLRARRLLRDRSRGRGRAGPCGGGATVLPMSDLSPDYFTKPLAEVDPRSPRCSRTRPIARRRRSR